MKYKPKENCFTFSEIEVNSPYMRVFEAARQARLAGVTSSATTYPRPALSGQQPRLGYQQQSEQELHAAQPEFDVQPAITVGAFAQPKAKRAAMVLVVLILFVAILAVSALSFFEATPFTALFQVNPPEEVADVVDASPVFASEPVMGLFYSFGGVEGFIERQVATLTVENISENETESESEGAAGEFWWFNYFAVSQFAEMTAEELNEILLPHQQALGDDFAMFSLVMQGMRASFAAAANDPDFEGAPATDTMAAYGLPISIMAFALTALAGLVVALIALIGKKRLAGGLKITAMIMFIFAFVMVICGFFFHSTLAEEADFMGYLTFGEGLSLAAGGIIVFAVALIAFVMSFFTYKSKKKLAKANVLQHTEGVEIAEAAQAETLV
jgi:hypothetical protein